MFRRTAPACAALVLALGVATGAGAQPTTPPLQLDEAAVIERVRAADPRVRSAAALAHAAAARQAGAGLHPNPQLQWGREHMPDSGNAEDVLAVAVPVLLSGRLPAQRALARSQGALARAAAMSEASDATVDALEAFYAALAATERADIMAAAVARLRRGVEVLGRRQQEGTASGYDRARVALELALTESQLRQARADTQLIGAGLIARLGPDANGAQWVGTLRPPEGADAGATAVPPSSHGSSPTMRATADAAGHARDAAADAERAWLPRLQLRGGVLHASGQRSETGYVAGVSLGLPLWSHGQGVRAQAAAAERLAEARQDARAWSRSRATATAQRTLDARLAELAQVERATGTLLAGLQRAADSGYREGHHGVLQLLDAQRASTRVALRRLELTHGARRAELAMRAARGDFE